MRRGRSRRCSGGRRGRRRGWCARGGWGRRGASATAAAAAGAAGDRRPPETARRVWRVAALGESHVDHRLAGLLDGIEGATLHFRIAYPENLVTVVVRRADRADAEAVLDRLDA